jgi:hypothetical protein
MSNTNTGGPAFPHTRYYSKEHPIGFEIGMTLRDYFAIKSFQVRLAKYDDWTLTELTEQAYLDANAMLEARKA